MLRRLVTRFGRRLALNAATVHAALGAVARREGISCRVPAPKRLCDAGCTRTKPLGKEGEQMIDDTAPPNAKALLARDDGP
jgi:hypothetical protein